MIDGLIIEDITQTKNDKKLTAAKVLSRPPCPMM